MKAYTSRSRFDEARRFTGVFEQMGRVRLDADHNEQVLLAETDRRRRSADLAEGSPDDGFRVGSLHLLDLVLSTRGWTVTPLAADAEDERIVRSELTLTRRDPETLPHVVRSRGNTRLLRTLPAPVDLLHLPVPLHPGGATFAASALVLQVRFARPPTDDEERDVTVLLLDQDGVEHSVGGEVDTTAEGWRQLRLDLGLLAALPRGTDAEGRETLVLRGWGLSDLPPRAEVWVDDLLVEDAGLGSGDLVLRGGNGTLGGAGRLYAQGLRVFIEHDWRYSLQPDLPRPPALAEPAGADRATVTDLVYADLWSREVTRIEDEHLLEPALDGDDTTFRRRLLTQVRVLRTAPGTDPAGALATPTGGGLLTTDVPAGSLPDRFPAEAFDPCRDRCLLPENVSTGQGYRGTSNAHVRIELFQGDGGGSRTPIVLWSRDNASTVAPLRFDAAPSASSVVLEPQDAARFRAGDLVVIEDRNSRLDPDGDRPAVLRRLRAVDTATGILELHDDSHHLAEDPAALVAGGVLGRAFTVAEQAFVRRWDGGDWLLTGVRYNLADGISFAFAGDDLRTGEYWSFVVRVNHPDGAAHGWIEPLDRAPVHGPHHVRVPLARISYPGSSGRSFQDLRRRFLPLAEVRDRLIELGARKLAPGAFTVVVGDGVRTFGDIDQDLVEGVTGDEAIQAALDRLGPQGGTIYLRAGTYKLEHPVLIQNRSGVRILGDGDATRLQVVGAGGAFYLDRCGSSADVSLELLSLSETPEAETPIGAAALGVDLDTAAGAEATEPLAPADLAGAAPTVDAVVAELAGNLRLLKGWEGRAAASVVRTITSLRRKQRLEPGRPLEDVAPDELSVLRQLPHGVITIADSRRVEVRRCTLHSEERGDSSGGVAAGILVTGACEELALEENRIDAPSGVVAAPYARFLGPQAIARLPRSGLFLRALTVRANQLSAHGDATYGVRIADGLLEAIRIEDNEIRGFPHGIAMEDRAEASEGQPVDRTVVSGNRVTGATRVGILVSGDGADIDGNEVHNAAGTATVQAGIQVTGSACRVRDAWIRLPALPAPSPLGVFAGLLIGDGLDQGGAAARPVGDVDVTGCRIEGTGTVPIATGIAVGGAQPVFGLRIEGNSLRNLGGAAVRAWGHGGPVGGLRIQGNRIESVARAWQGWDPAILTLLAAQVPSAAAALRALASPTARDVLEVLLAQPTDVVRPALDGLLRWLDHATLRGGICLSLVEESEVRDNQVVDVGTNTLPAGYLDPGAEVRTAGVAVAGGRELTVQDNEIARIHGAVARETPPSPQAATTDATAPIVDYLDALALGASAGEVTSGNLFDSIVAIRRMSLDYAQGGRRERQALGGRIYAALEAMEHALADAGGEASRLRRELADGTDKMQQAQSAAGHTRAANVVRATLSRAAALTAPDEATAQAWNVAGDFDHALLGEDADVAELTADLLERAAELVRGLDKLDLRLAERLRSLHARPGEEKRRLAVADELGRLAEARAAQHGQAKAAVGADLSADERTVIERLSDYLDRGLVQAGTDPARLNREELASLDKATSALVKQVDKHNRTLSRNLATDWSTLAKAEGQVRGQDVDAFRKSLGQVVALAKEEMSVGELDATEIGRQRARQDAELIVLTARNIDARIRDLATDPSSSAARQLRLLQANAQQLYNLLRGDKALAARARALVQAIEAGVEDGTDRSRHLARARDELGEILAALAAQTRGPAPATSPVKGSASAGAERWRRVAGMGQLALALRGAPATERLRGADTLHTQLSHLLDGLGASAFQRKQAADRVAEARRSLGEGAGEAARQAALHLLAAVVDEAASASAQAKDAVTNDVTVAVLAGAAQRALDTSRSATDRLTLAKGYLAVRGRSLSASVQARLLGATSADAMLEVVSDELSRLTRVKLRPRPAPSTAEDSTVAITPQPADGLFAAGVQDRLELGGNRVTATRLGIGVRGESGHVLAEPLDGQGLILDVAGNRLLGCVTAALDLRPEGTSAVAVAGNHALGCAGISDAAQTAWGQAVVHVSGAGELALSGNQLHDNGTDDAQGLLHEVLLDWRGDLSVEGNRLRHAGGGAGGAGLLVLTASISADTLARLCTEPALEVEPAPAPPTEEKDEGPTTGFGLSPALAAGLGSRASLLGSRAGSFSLGGLSTTTRVARPTYDLLSKARTPAKGTTLSRSFASAWLAATPTPTLRPVLDFIGRVPLRPILPRPVPPRRTVQVDGNDVVAAGPALLVVADSSVLVGLTATGNHLESSADTGAVYLRQVDSTVFSGNRCECLDEVNVVVIRTGQSLVSATGNTVAGREPPAPPPEPTPPTRPGGTGPSLLFPLDKGAWLNLDLDQDKLLSVIEANRDVAFKGKVSQAKEAYDAFVKAKDIGPVAAAAQPVSTPSWALPAALSQPMWTASWPALFPLIATASGAEEAGPAPAEAPARVMRGIPEAAEVGDATAPKAAAESTATSAGWARYDVSHASIAMSSEMSPLGKLYAVARSTGQSEVEAELYTGKLLAQFAGDEGKALDAAISDVTGVASAAPTVTATIGKVDLLEELVYKTLLDRGVKPVGPEAAAPQPPPPPPPDPRDHSLVVIGGSRVSAVGNATTAGVHVHDAARSVQNNP